MEGLALRFPCVSKYWPEDLWDVGETIHHDASMVKIEFVFIEVQPTRVYIYNIHIIRYIFFKTNVIYIYIYVPFYHHVPNWNQKSTWQICRKTVFLQAGSQYPSSLLHSFYKKYVLLKKQHFFKCICICMCDTYVCTQMYTYIYIYIYTFIMHAMQVQVKHVKTMKRCLQETDLSFLVWTIQLCAKIVWQELVWKPVRWDHQLWPPWKPPRFPKSSSGWWF